MDGLGVDDLRGCEILEYVVLNFKQVNRQFFVQRLTEFLRQVNEKVKYIVLLVCEKNALLQVSLATLQTRQSSIVVLWNLEQLLEENYDKLDHLLVLLTAFWLL